MNTTAIRAEQPSDQSDAQLLTEVLGGNLEAFAGIIRHHNQRMFRIARSIVTDDAEAMDAVQESFITAYERLEDLKEPQALGVWLARIVRNTALMRLRRNRRYQFMETADLDNVLEMSVPQPHQRLPEGEVANIQLRRLLEECIDELPEAFRSVFMLRAVEQCSTSATAEILEIEEATVKTRFHRAKRLIQQRLLACFEAAGVGVHEFAGHRCDTIVHNVMQNLREKQPGREG
ncbi:MAG TPA: RNA polymerase sigma factor [Woeseiaceae bacterium]|nr:RNA polymerase sigma factor [Woeseiaceae bacterium]